jgi:hypothetical protein
MMRVRGSNEYLSSRLLQPLCVLAALVLGACVQTRPYSSLSTSAEPLRTQFNADAGRVRIVMLVAPT